MHCPRCGITVTGAEKCPSCGIDLAAVDARPAYPVGAVSRGFHFPIASVIALLFIGAFLFAYLNSNTHKILKAKKLIENEEYTRGIDILYGIMERTGPTEDLLLMASDGLRAYGEARLDAEEFEQSLPLFDEIIKINEASLGAGGSETSIMYAYYDKVIAFLQMAQGAGTYIEPYGRDILNAEASIRKVYELLEEPDVERPEEIESEIHFLAAAVAAERCSAFWHENNIPQARVYLIEAEDEFSKAVSLHGNTDRFGLLREELVLLRERVEEDSWK